MVVKRYLSFCVLKFHPFPLPLFIPVNLDFTNICPGNGDTLSNSLENFQRPRKDTFNRTLCYHRLIRHNPSPLHTRTHYRAGSHTLARLRASLSAGVVQGPPSHHVHRLLLLQFLPDPSSPAAEDAAQRHGLPTRRPRRREWERCGRRRQRRGLRPGCGSRAAAAAHPRHGALPAPAGQPAQSHAPARRRRLAGQPPGARSGPRPQPAQPDAAAGRGPHRAGAAGQGPPETVPREPPEEQLT